jgi:hypothetical protein
MAFLIRVWQWGHAAPIMLEGTETVGAVALEAAHRLGVEPAPGHRAMLALNGEVLIDDEQTAVAAGIRQGDNVDLIINGGPHPCV